MKRFILVMLVLSISAFAKDPQVETLEAFKKRTCTRPSPIPGTAFRSWNVQSGPQYYVAFPATEEMGRAGASEIPPVWIGPQEAEIAIAFSVLSNERIKKLSTLDCASIGNFLWKTKCEGGKCKFTEEKIVVSDGREFKQYRTTIKANGVPTATYYQCSIGQNSTVSVLAAFNKPHGPFRRLEDLGKVLSNIYISQAKE